MIWSAICTLFYWGAIHAVICLAVYLLHFFCEKARIWAYGVKERLYNLEELTKGHTGSIDNNWEWILNFKSRVKILEKEVLILKKIAHVDIKKAADDAENEFVGGQN